MLSNRANNLIHGINSPFNFVINFKIKTHNHSLNGTASNRATLFKGLGVAR